MLFCFSGCWIFPRNTVSRQNWSIAPVVMHLTNGEMLRCHSQLVTLQQITLTLCDASVVVTHHPSTLVSGIRVPCVAPKYSISSMDRISVYETADWGSSPQWSAKNLILLKIYCIIYI